MSWLPIVLNSLTEEELFKLKALKLIGKERLVYNYVLSFRKKSIPEKTKICSHLEISETHYYKINSVLLSKIYIIFTDDNNPLSLFGFLKSKGLFTLVKHEILAKDKEIIKEKEENKNTAFYLNCFHLLIDLPYKFYDEKLTNQFGGKYLKTLANCTESDNLYITYHKLFSDFNRNAARKNAVKNQKIQLSDLLEEEKKLAASTHYLACYYLYRTIISYYTFYKSDSAKILEYVKKATQLKDKIAYLFPIDIGVFLELLYADSLMFASKTEEAYSIYHKAFSKGVPTEMYGYYYHCEQYGLVSIIMKQCEQAEQFLKEVFTSCIDDKTDIYATRGALTFAKLYLSCNDYKQAIHYINIAKQINEKSFYLPFDLQLRVLENIYFYLKNDFLFAKQLATRNIKFIKGQHNNQTFENYILLFKSIIAFTNQIEEGTAIEKTILKKQISLQNGFKNLYCNLVEKLMVNIG